MTSLLRAMLATTLLMLAGCDDEAASPREVSGALQSIRQDADGNTTDLFNFDYENGRLARIRHYSGAGDDGKFGTSDDVMSKWIACNVETTGAPLLELLVFPVPTSTPESCAHNGLQASRAESIYFNSPGADGEWLTSDDVNSGTAVITRTGSGSHYTYTEANCEECRNTETHTEYLLDGSNRLIGVRRGETSKSLYHYLSGSRLIREDNPDPYSGFGISAKYHYKNNKTEVELECLIRDYGEFISSPSTQLILSIIGCSYFPEGHVTIDGIEYARFKVSGHHYVITYLLGGFVEIKARHGGLITLRYGQP